MWNWMSLTTDCARWMHEFHTSRGGSIQPRCCSQHMSFIHCCCLDRMLLPSEYEGQWLIAKWWRWVCNNSFHTYNGMSQPTMWSSVYRNDDMEMDSDSPSWRPWLIGLGAFDDPFSFNRSINFCFRVSVVFFSDGKDGTWSFCLFICMLSFWLDISESERRMTICRMHYVAEHHGNGQHFFSCVDAF
jgi:hypothetical protein